MRDKFNYGLAILRGLMSFEVILSRLWVDSYSVHDVFTFLENWGLLLYGKSFYKLFQKRF